MSVSARIGDIVDEASELPSSINGFRIEPRCRVCRNDDVRKKVNDLLATGSSYAMILRALGDDNAATGESHRVTIDSIRNHGARHFPVQQAARATYREIIERRAQEAQIDFVNGLATALTPIAFYECVMNDAFRQLAKDDVDVSIDTGLRAAEKLQALIDARAAGADVAGLIAQVGRIIGVVKAFVPSERWPEVQAMLRGDSVEHWQQPSPAEGARMVAIDDTPDEDRY